MKNQLRKLGKVNEKHKSLSAVLTSLVIITLILMGPANAVSINISNIDESVQGSTVNFQIEVDLTTPDMYLPIAYTNLIFTDPSNNQFSCKVYNDGSIENSTECENLSVTTNFNLTYGEGHQFGYGYGYDSNHGYGYENTYFGYGYGYGYAGENGKITYNATLQLTNSSETGDYKVKAETYVASEDSFDDNQGFTYCDTMFGMYQGYYNMVPQNGTYYDATLDLNNDSKIDLSDISLFAGSNTYNSTDSEMFGRFVEYYRFRSTNGTINPELDVHPEEGDGVINLSDLAVFASNYYSNESESWCASQISLIPGVERKYISNEQTFEVTEFIPSEDPQEVTPTGGNGGTTTLVCADGYVKDLDTNLCVLIEQNSNTESNSTDENLTDGMSMAEIEPKDSNGFFAPITGAVTGALGTTGSILLVLILLALLGFLIFYLKRKKK